MTYFQLHCSSKGADEHFLDVLSFTFFGITQSFFKLEPTNFAWKQIQIISINDDDEDDDNDHDHDDGDGDDEDNDDDNDYYSCNSVNFQARTSRFCMEINIDNTYR